MPKYGGLVLAACILVTLAATADPTVTFGPTSFGVASLTPNGKVVIYGVGDGRSDGSELISKQSAVLTADSSGHLDVKIDHPAFRSIWLVFDLKADAYVIATPPGYHAVPMRTLPVVNSDSDTITAFRPLSFVFVAHAPDGAWETFSGDGSASDDGGRGDGRVAATLRRLTPIGDSPPSPAHLVPGDVVMTIDPYSMAFAAFRVPKGGSGAH
jgi:hypothetical protein